jgi:hypothetical protein
MSLDIPPITMDQDLLDLVRRKLFTRLKRRKIDAIKSIEKIVSGFEPHQLNLDSMYGCNLVAELTDQTKDVWVDIIGSPGIQQ